MISVRLMRGAHRWCRSVVSFSDELRYVRGGPSSGEVEAHQAAVIGLSQHWERGAGGVGDSPRRSILRYPHPLLFDLISHLVYTEHRLLRGANCRKLHMEVSPSRTI